MDFSTFLSLHAKLEENIGAASKQYFAMHKTFYHLCNISSSYSHFKFIHGTNHKSCFLCCSSKNMTSQCSIQCSNYHSDRNTAKFPILSLVLNGGTSLLEKILGVSNWSAAFSNWLDLRIEFVTPTKSIVLHHYFWLLSLSELGVQFLEVCFITVAKLVVQHQSKIIPHWVMSPIFLRMQFPKIRG